MLVIVMNEQNYRAPRVPVMTPNRRESTPVDEVELPPLDFVNDEPKPKTPPVKNVSQEAKTPADEWLSVPECARVVGVSDKTMRGLLRKHEVPVLRLSRNIRVHRNDFRAMLKKLRGTL